MRSHSPIKQAAHELLINFSAQLALQKALSPAYFGKKLSGSFRLFLNRLCCCHPFHSTHIPKPPLDSTPMSTFWIESTFDPGSSNSPQLWRRRKGRNQSPSKVQLCPGSNSKLVPQLSNMIQFINILWTLYASQYTLQHFNKCCMQIKVFRRITIFLLIILWLIIKFIVCTKVQFLTNSPRSHRNSFQYYKRKYSKYNLLKSIEGNGSTLFLFLWLFWYSLKWIIHFFFPNVGTLLMLYWSIYSVHNLRACFCNITWEGTLFGGSIRIDGSHSPGGKTVTWSKNSSIPDNKSFRSFAL